MLIIFFKDVFERFKYIIDILYVNLGKGLEREELINIVHLIYELNPDSKGKSRKIQEVINIINSCATAIGPFVAPSPLSP